MKKSNSGGKSGKGDKPRNCFSKKYKENFDKIDWKKMKFEYPPSEKVYLYPDYLNELICALMGEKVSPESYAVSDESMVRDFLVFGEGLSKAALKLQRKYGIKELKTEDYIMNEISCIRKIK